MWGLNVKQYRRHSPQRDKRPPPARGGLFFILSIMSKEPTLKAVTRYPLSDLWRSAKECVANLALASLARSHIVTGDWLQPRNQVCDGSSTQSIFS
jgi:hypothetical protein